MSFHVAISSRCPTHDCRRHRSAKINLQNKFDGFAGVSRAVCFAQHAHPRTHHTRAHTSRRNITRRISFYARGWCPATMAPGSIPGGAFKRVDGGETCDRAACTVSSAASATESCHLDSSAQPRCCSQCWCVEPPCSANAPYLDGRCIHRCIQRKHHIGRRFPIFVVGRRVEIFSS